MTAASRIVALAGGVGGARLCHGLTQQGTDLTVIVNTADDFDHLGLHISPDIDTVLYTLSGLADEERGWGLANESWAFLEQLGRLGAPDWFRLGDRDLATHVVRTHRLRAGERLTSITLDLAEQLRVPGRILPMSDSPVRTMVATGHGELPFQDYFVHQRCEPVITGFRFSGVAQAKPTPEVVSCLRDPDLAAIIICPSNPFVSIDPILSVADLKTAILQAQAPVVGISPIIGGHAVKGPAAKMMRELGLDPSPLGVARYYQGILQGGLKGFMIDHADVALKAAIEALEIRVTVTDALMRSVPDRARLAAECAAFAHALR